PSHDPSGVSVFISTDSMSWHTDAPACTLLSLTFHAHRDAHATADAERGEALLGITPLHLVQQRHHHAPARRADRMADRDRATVDVALRSVRAEILVDRAGLRREGLIGLDQIEILDLPARLLERCTRRRDWTSAHDRRVDAGMRPGDDPRQRSLAA